ncbi:MAG: helicase-related protein, partial [Sulfobacillus sp.]
WKREPREMAWDLPTLSVGHNILKSDDGMEVQIRLRQSRSVWTATFSVLNHGPKSSDPDRRYDQRAFQVAMEIDDLTGDGAFVAHDFRPSLDDDEYWRDEIRYRRLPTYAVGHGCAVRWNGNPVTRLVSEWIPAYNMRRAATTVMADAPALSLKSLSDPIQRDATLMGLTEIVRTYRSWIGELTTVIPDVVREDFPQEVQDYVGAAAEDIVKDNLHACHRIEEGIVRLRTDDFAWEAFCLANDAMMRSMIQRHPGTEPRWRAFQLAFILLAFSSAIDQRHPERKIFDLIWFPTGGGKTEAYLGLAALVIFYRRLRGQKGLAVLTRYTLRLLTVQQFERTARLICAADLVRQSHSLLRDTEPISVGLFVGRQLTPNNLDDATQLLKDPNPEGTTTTLPLLNCPWCGHRLENTSQHVTTVLVTACGNPDCPFADEIPIRVVDEDLYQLPPDMVVATLDKLARMPWEPRMSMLFGNGPDLIIQDELHLIGDALGSLAALYETAVDSLASRGGVPPKIIGSTATSRRADRQVAILFQRQFQQFPPGGIDVSDAFFYQEDQENPGRLYVGVLASGRSMPHTLERVAGILLQSVTAIENPIVRDQYWTLALYFKALRELGGALVLMQDSVPRYMDTLVPPGTDARPIQLEELTSQVPSRKIPEILARLAQPLPELQSPDQLLLGEPVDVVLATNMLSVGIDVDRLGIMVLDGQPHSTAEYIQATSRVGRRPEAAGLVVTLYNWARPRDRSIYEHFYPYHAAMYRHVEAVSATPFSLRARERALHAVFFTLVRYRIPEFYPRESAGRIREPAIRALICPLTNEILQRVKAVDPEEELATRQHLEQIVTQWESLADDFPELYWSSRPFRDDPAVMTPGESATEALLGWITLQSLRDVSPPAAVRIIPYRQLHKRRQEVHRG